MAENIYLDLTVAVACERYELDEHEWALFTFTDGAKNITVGLENMQTGAKIRATFPREEIRFEEMKRWDEPKKVLFLQNMIENGKELPPQLVDSFQHAMLKLDLPTAEPDEEDSVLVEVTSYENGAVTEVTEETPEEFEKKVGKKIFKRKAV